MTDRFLLDKNSNSASYSLRLIPVNTCGADSPLTLMTKSNVRPEPDQARTTPHTTHHTTHNTMMLGCCALLWSHSRTDLRVHTCALQASKLNAYDLLVADKDR